MQWVGLFLFDHGLATFSGAHASLSLLFPMGQVFEDFVTDSFRSYQEQYTVTAQGPRRQQFSGWRVWLVWDGIGGRLCVP